MNTKHFSKAVLLFTTLLWLSSCQKKMDVVPEDPSFAKKADNPGFVENDMVLYWNEKAAAVVFRSPGPPPVLSRHMTMVQIAVYDALNAIKPKYKSYALIDYREKDADPDAAVASAAYWTFKNLDSYLRALSPNPGSLALSVSGNDWEGWYASALSTIEPGEAKDKGIALGQLAADAIMAKRAGDNYATARLVYLPVPPYTQPAGIWRPTLSQPPVPAFHNGGLPLWASQMKPFAVHSNDQFRPDAPPALTSDAYASSYNQVKSLGARIGSTRTAEQSLLANFWQESPATIWNRFTREAIQNKNMDAWKAARLFALVNTSMFDAFLTAFDGMYTYHSWRPESAIRLGDTDGNDNTTVDATWVSFTTDIKVGPGLQTPTPPIPEYPNGNAALGSAIAEVFRSYFGSDETDVNLVTNDVTVPGSVINYTSFSKASQEYSLSRLYAGFNFPYSLEVGEGMGAKVGKLVFEQYFTEQ
jgi:hypothetical protein